MRGTSDSRIFRSRLAQLIALGGAITTAACTDATAPQQIVGILNSLKGHLKSGKIAASQQDLADGRAFLESLSEQKRVETGAVGVTLDLIQATLEKASQ